jgi:hypothetical protein
LLFLVYNIVGFGLGVTQLLVLTVRSKIDIRDCIQLILLICNLNHPISNQWLWFKTRNCANSVIVDLYQCIINHLFCAVHFWAPAFKWGISIANIADFTKPPEKISYPQQIGMHMHIELHVVLSIADFSVSQMHVRAIVQFSHLWTCVFLESLQGADLCKWMNLRTAEYSCCHLQAVFSIYSRVWHLCVADYFCF